MKQVLIFAAALLALAATNVFAAHLLTPPPIPVSGMSGGTPVDAAYPTNAAGGAINGSNALITFNANGSIATTCPTAQPFYDSGGDDPLIGVINSTSHATTNFTLSGIPAGGNSCFGLGERVTLGLQVSSAPEPASLVLVGAGLVALGVIRRRRKNKRDV